MDWAIIAESYLLLNDKKRLKQQVNEVFKKRSPNDTGKLHSHDKVYIIAHLLICSIDNNTTSFAALWQELK
jgi:hypothetical protein